MPPLHSPEPCDVHRPVWRAVWQDQHATGGGLRPCKQLRRSLGLCQRLQLEALAGLLQELRHDAVVLLLRQRARAVEHRAPSLDQHGGAAEELQLPLSVGLHGPRSPVCQRRLSLAHEVPVGGARRVHEHTIVGAQALELHGGRASGSVCNADRDPAGPNCHQFLRQEGGEHPLQALRSRPRGLVADEPSRPLSSLLCRKQHCGQHGSLAAGCRAEV
mmetsp:Transcript_31531/g.90418  ORF Transcript_31531/g.90418 Transcript_31531/m.90418 type:complete len:217 (-) Transcript_31531:479-1129(-)